MPPPPPPTQTTQTEVTPAGAVQEKETYDSVVNTSSLTKVVGASGATSAIGIAAPLPSLDTADSPRELIAVTLAKTEARSCRSNGDVLRVSSTLTVQVLEEMMVESFSASQSVNSCSKVLVAVLISTLYPVMSRPP